VVLVADALAEQSEPLEEPVRRLVGVLGVRVALDVAEAAVDLRLLDVESAGEEDGIDLQRHDEDLVGEVAQRAGAREGDDGLGDGGEEHAEAGQLHSPPHLLEADRVLLRRERKRVFGHGPLLDCRSYPVVPIRRRSRRGPGQNLIYTARYTILDERHRKA